MKHKSEQYYESAFCKLAIKFAFCTAVFNSAHISSVPDYPHAKHFSWEKYLEETSSLPAPARAFKVVRKCLHFFMFLSAYN